MNVMRWPSKSPHFHPIENMCGVFSRAFCGGLRQYSNVRDLKAILKEWEQLDKRYL